VLFSGKRDGAFIFDMRELANERQDISILRTEKLFFEMAVSPRYGVKTIHDLSEQQIAAVLDSLNVETVAVQNDFMLDTPVIQRLQSVLDSPRFTKVNVVSLPATVFGAEDTSITVYRRSGIDRVTGALPDFDISLPIIGQKVDLTHRRLADK
jgi:hypothetical protein